MKNKVMNGFERLTKTSARKAFESGKEVMVMSIDRNPVQSITSPYTYYIGCKPLCSEITAINTFDELLEDFSEWLDTDGYGHIPQRYDAKHYRFSYWVKG